MAISAEQKTLHYELKDVGLRAQATAVGLLQLCKELQRAGHLDEAAVTRIKNSIADEIALTAPRSVDPKNFRSEVCGRLDQLFAGEAKVGDADALTFATEPVRS